jgi:hypothetical protein
MRKDVKNAVKTKTKKIKVLYSSFLFTFLIKKTEKLKQSVKLKI